MKASRRQVAIVLGMAGVLLLSTFAAVGSGKEHPLLLKSTPGARIEVPLITRECEYPPEYTVGTMIYRSNASEDKVHGQFGCEGTSGYPAKSGYAKYVDIYIPSPNRLYLTLRYSRYNYSLTATIDVYIDDELRASFYPTNMGNWNTFTSTTVPLGSVYSGTHSIKFYTDGQKYGVADLDVFTITNSLVQTLLPLVVRESAH